jgi:hypothetical protein
MSTIGLMLVIKRLSFGINDIDNMVLSALSDTYYENRMKACYELTNAGAWDGFVRVCFNFNQSQTGCFSCGEQKN